MKRTYIKKLMPQDESVIAGWVEKVRDQKAMQFLVVRDVTGSIQVTIVKEEQPEIAEKVAKLTKHSVVKIKGKCKNTMTYSVMLMHDAIDRIYYQ